MSQGKDIDSKELHTSNPERHREAQIATEKHREHQRATEERREH